MSLSVGSQKKRKKGRTGITGRLHKSFTGWCVQRRRWGVSNVSIDSQDTAAPPPPPTPLSPGHKGDKPGTLSPRLPLPPSYTWQQQSGRIALRNGTQRCSRSCVYLPHLSCDDKVWHVDKWEVKVSILSSEWDQLHYSITFNWQLQY